jgi:hypothetical protein
VGDFETVENGKMKRFKVRAIREYHGDVLTAASTFVFGNKFPKTPEPLVSVSPQLSSAGLRTFKYVSKELSCGNHLLHDD